jgi:rhodanese-related sulfurtransferase
MARETYKTLVAKLAGQVEEVFPWDLDEELKTARPPLLLDIRCPHEFAVARIAGSINVPRGILESAVDYGYDETEPELVEARDRRVVVICRSGNRSILACHTLNLMGYTNTVSLKTGLRGWNDYELPLIDETDKRIDFDEVDELFTSNPTPEQLGPVHHAA